MCHHTLVLQRLAAVKPEDSAISSITSYELFTGVEKVRRPGEERAKVGLLLATISELDFDGEAAKGSRCIVLFWSHRAV